jgi:hypothetical protein
MKFGNFFCAVLIGSFGTVMCYFSLSVLCKGRRCSGMLIICNLDLQTSATVVVVVMMIVMMMMMMMMIIIIFL